MISPIPRHQASESIAELIDRQARERPEARFLIDPENGAVETYASMQGKVRVIASSLHEHGIQPGDAVAYAFSNGSDSALAILGILYGGFLATAVNLVAGSSTIGYVLEHSRARLVICDDLGYKTVMPHLQNADVRVVRLGEIEGTAEGVFGPKVESTRLDGLLMYTSGTTGRPKGVVLTHANLIAGGTNTAIAHKLTRNDCGLCVLPLYHINAFCVSLMGSLVSGGSLVLPNRFSVKSFWKTLASNDCSWFSIVPTQVSYLLHDQQTDAAKGNKRLRFGRSASAPLSPELHAEFEKRFGIPLIETMGLTETAAQILSNPLPPGERKIGSPGIAFGNEVIIADSSHNEVPRGDEGEILVRGSNVLRCYLRNKEATREAITVNGWLRTGDLGKMDEDGYVYVTGRLKELIIKGGENIAPREIDEALYSHPDVVEAAAFGVACEDYGQRVEAGVSLCEGSTTTEKQLIDICAERIGSFKAPDHIHFLAELPKGPSGKIQRNKLNELILNPPAASR